MPESLSSAALEALSAPLPASGMSTVATVWSALVVDGDRLRSSVQLRGRARFRSAIAVRTDGAVTSNT